MQGASSEDGKYPGNACTLYELVLSECIWKHKFNDSNVYEIWSINFWAVYIFVIHAYVTS